MSALANLEKECSRDGVCWRDRISCEQQHNDHPQRPPTTTTHNDHPQRLVECSANEVRHQAQNSHLDQLRTSAAMAQNLLFSKSFLVWLGEEGRFKPMSAVS